MSPSASLSDMEGGVAFAGVSGRDGMAMASMVDVSGAVAMRRSSSARGPRRRRSSAVMTETATGPSIAGLGSWSGSGSRGEECETAEPSIILSTTPSLTTITSSSSSSSTTSSSSASRTMDSSSSSSRHRRHFPTISVTRSPSLPIALPSTSVATATILPSSSVPSAIPSTFTASPSAHSLRTLALARVLTHHQGRDADALQVSLDFSDSNGATYSSPLQTYLSDSASTPRLYHSQLFVHDSGSAPAVSQSPTPPRRILTARDICSSSATACVSFTTADTATSSSDSESTVRQAYPQQSILASASSSSSLSDSISSLSSTPSSPRSTHAELSSDDSTTATMDHNNNYHHHRLLLDAPAGTNSMYHVAAAAPHSPPASPPLLSAPPTTVSAASSSFYTQNAAGMASMNGFFIHEDEEEDEDDGVQEGQLFDGRDVILLKQNQEACVHGRAVPLETRKEVALRRSAGSLDDVTMVSAKATAPKTPSSSFQHYQHLHPQNHHNHHPHYQPHRRNSTGGGSAPRPILKKSTSTPHFGATLPGTTSPPPLDSAISSPRQRRGSLSGNIARATTAGTQSRFRAGSAEAAGGGGVGPSFKEGPLLSIHTSKSAPDLFATPEWAASADDAYRGVGRRDSVKSLCFDNVIKKVCVFSSDESPARIAQSPRYVIESSDDGSSPDSEIEEIRFGYDATHQRQLEQDFEHAFAAVSPFAKMPVTKIYEPWVVSSRTPKIPTMSMPVVSMDSLLLSATKSSTILSPSSNPTSPILSGSSPASPTTATSQQPQRLTATILIRNLAYAKTVRVRYTTDGWNSFHEVEATYQGIVMPSTPTSPGIDRFMAALEVDRIQPPTAPSLAQWYESGRDYEHETLVFEVAVHGVMSGVEHWDNNGGRNHGIVLRRSVRLLPLMSAATAALMVASKGALRTVEAVVEAAQEAAVRNAAVMAEEAKAIERDFGRRMEGRRGLFGVESEERGGVAQVGSGVIGVGLMGGVGGAGQQRVRHAKLSNAGRWGENVAGHGGATVRRRSSEGSLAAPSFFEDDDDQDTVVPAVVTESTTGFTPSCASAFHHDWAFGSSGAPSSYPQGTYTQQSAGMYQFPGPSHHQQHVMCSSPQYQTDTLYSLSSRAGSPVSMTGGLSSFSNLYNQLHSPRTQQMQLQQQFVKHDLKSELQKHDFKIETSQPPPIPLFVSGAGMLGSPMTSSSSAGDAPPRPLPQEDVSFVAAGAGSFKAGSVATSSLLMRHFEGSLGAGGNHSKQTHAQHNHHYRMRRSKSSVEHAIAKSSAKQQVSDDLYEILHGERAGVTEAIEDIISKSIDGWSLWDNADADAEDDGF
ncbi:hypothetical protein BC830DRAFT_1191533 [Chytriomyces sp. MP71]|nr:hypothetical protein BC830DRAFT_1191533 [Chytriomyces sp. MP71]